MRGDDQQSGHLFSYLSPEQRVPADHPLRAIRQMTDEALRQLSPQFEAIYATTGRPSVPPEQLLRALLLQALYTVRSERMLVEQLEYNLLFRWFVGLGMDDAVWTPTTFTKNRERLLAGDIARQFFDGGGGPGARAAAAVGRALHGRRHADRSVGRAEELHAEGRHKPRAAGRRPGNPTVNFHGERGRMRRTSRRPIPTAGWSRKAPGKEAKLGYSAKC